MYFITKFPAPSIAGDAAPPSRYVPNRTPEPLALSLRTNPFSFPFRFVWGAPGVTGRSVEDTVPVIHAFPAASTAIPYALLFDAPKYVSTYINRF